MCRVKAVPLDQLPKTLYKAYTTLLRFKISRSVAFHICYNAYIILYNDTRAWRLRPFVFNQRHTRIIRVSRAGARALGRARRLRALRRGRRGCGALGLERLAAALAVGGLEGGVLGLVRGHVRVEGGARRVDVRLEGGVGGDVGDEVPVATAVHARHEPVGDAARSADLYAHVRLCFAVEGPRVHGLEERALTLRVGFGARAGGSVGGGGGGPFLGWLNLSGYL
jgi:hypothetical protein